jgi:nucleoside-diphosphate-sugar epimerase
MKMHNQSDTKLVGDKKIKKLKFNHVLITGGAGYCGSVLVPQMLDIGYRVTVYDIQYYGCNFLPLENPNLNVIQGDIRDIKNLEPLMADVNAVLHLACISDVKEDHPLLPLTLYNKYKGMCEPILFKHTDENFVGVVYRPATVCGYGPRQRLDVSVNILTNLAVNKGNITVFGGSQLRPNLHIQDYADLCKILLEAPDKQIANQIFNCGYENMSIMEIAETVKKVVAQEFPDKDEIGIEVTPSDDLRSYHINSDKITEILGFKPQYSVEDAIRDLCRAFREGKLPNSFDDDNYFNVRTMKKIGAT